MTVSQMHIFPIKIKPGFSLSDLLSLPGYNYNATAYFHKIIIYGIILTIMYVCQKILNLYLVARCMDAQI